MKAVILNSGTGSRMGERTKDSPKCLTKVKENETILSHQLNLLQSNKVNKVLITTGPFEEKIKQEVKEKFSELEIEYVQNDKFKETNYIYSLFLARKQIEEDILLLHGDMVMDKELFKRFLENSKKDEVLIDRKKPFPEKDFKGKIKEGKLLKIAVNLKSDDCFFLLPVYKLSKEFMKEWMRKIEEFVEKNKVTVYAENALNEILESLNLNPFYFENEFCMEIDNEKDLEKAKKFFSKQ